MLQKGISLVIAKMKQNKIHLWYQLESTIWPHKYFSQCHRTCKSNFHNKHFIIQLIFCSYPERSTVCLSTFLLWSLRFESRLNDCKMLRPAGFSPNVDLSSSFPVSLNFGRVIEFILRSLINPRTSSSVFCDVSLIGVPVSETRRNLSSAKDIKCHELN